MATKGILAVILTVLLAHMAEAQCPSRSQLKEALSTITPVALADQEKPLKNWLAQWQRCRYDQDSIYARALLQLSKVAYSKGEFKAAAELARQTMHLCEAAPKRTLPLNKIEGLYRLGMAHSQLKQFDEASRLLKQVIDQGHRVPGSARLIATTCSYLAYTFNSRGDYEQALTYAETGLNNDGLQRDSATWVGLLQQQGQSLFKLDKLTEADPVIRQAIALLKSMIQTNPDYAQYYTQSLVVCYRLCGIIARDQKKFTIARRYLEDALAIARSLKSPEVFQCANSLGILHVKIGQYQQAMRYGQLSLQVSTDRYEQGYSYDLIAQAYAGQHQWEKAQAAFRTGLWTIVGNAAQAGSLRLPKAIHLKPLGDKDLCLALLQDQGDAFLNQYTDSRNPQHLKLALQTYQLADTVINFMRWEHAGTVSKLYWRNTTRPTYENALKTCYLLNDPEQAFQFIEKSRAVLLRDRLNELSAARYLKPEQAMREQTLRSQVALLQEKLYDSDLHTKKQRLAEQSVLRAQHELELFLDSLEQSNKLYYRLKYDQSMVSLKQVQPWLKARQASYITYFTGDSALYMLSVTPTQVRLLRSNIASYNKALDTFMEQLQSQSQFNQNHRLFLQAAGRLYQQIMAPLGIPAGRLIVSHDGFFVPFETLSRSTGKPDYLLNDYAISYTYSAKQLLEESPEAAGGRLRFLGMAPVQFRPSLALTRLNGSDDALRSIGRLFLLPTLLTQQQATRRAFIECGPSYDIIQLTTHADADTSREQQGQDEPVLYFADSTLRLSELSSQEPFKARMVVMSACKTALGSLQKGEGVFSLARGFTSLGIPSVLTTLWSVEDQPTYDITNLFYQYLADGLPKDIALQQAKKHYIAEASLTNQSPVMWAGLIMIGDTKPIDMPSNVVILMTWAGILILPIISVIWGLRFRKREKTRSRLQEA